MFVHSIDPVIFQVFGLEVRYYGLVYALGFLFVLYMTLWLIRRDDLDVKKDDVYDLFFWIMLGALIGGRLFHVIFYNPAYFISHPLEIPALWLGGISIHGGVVGAVTAGLIFVRRKGYSFYTFADLIMVTFPLVLVFGRIANFINAELVGPVTGLPWCVVFPGYEGCRHPTVLYEAVKNLAIFSWQTFLFTRRNVWNYAAGTIFWSFVGLYSFLRFFAQFLRPEEKIFFGMDVAQLFSIVLFPLALYMLYRLNRVTLPKNRRRKKV